MRGGSRRTSRRRTISMSCRVLIDGKGGTVPADDHDRFWDCVILRGEPDLVGVRMQHLVVRRARGDLIVVLFRERIAAVEMIEIQVSHAAELRHRNGAIESMNEPGVLPPP